jgi:hypothetical protein
MINSLRMIRLSRHWGLSAPMAAIIALLAYGDARDE